MNTFYSLLNVTTKANLNTLDIRKSITFSVQELEVHERLKARIISKGIIGQDYTKKSTTIEDHDNTI